VAVPPRLLPKGKRKKEHGFDTPLIS